MASRLSFVHWLSIASAVLAGSVQAVTISPVLVELSTARRVVSVTITNPSDQAISFQTETLAWSQSDGKDHYEPTDELMVAPPIAEILPQSSQVFRVTLRRPLSDTVEQAYRLMLEDVSEALSSQPGVISLRFNHNLPVFISPAGEAKPLPRWSRCAAVAGKGCIQLDNNGGQRIRLSELMVAGTGWQQVLQGGTVLAGAWKQWRFDLPKGKNQPTLIKAKTEQGPISADLSSTPMP